MSVWEVLVYGTLGIAVLIVIVYVSVRVGSIAHFRTRDEYDRSMFNRDFGKSKGNGDSSDGKV